MPAWPEWILLAMLCVLDLVTGKIYKPLNITTESRDFCLYLTWLPDPHNVHNVTYDVKYKLVSELKWKSVPECKDIEETECNLTDVLIENYTNLHSVRVRAFSEKQKSSWANLTNISYMFTVGPGPPDLHIIQDNTNMMINVTLQEPTCKHMSLNSFITYKLEITSINNPHQKLESIPLNKYQTSIKTSQYRGEYCMAARTMYLKQISEPSKTICLHFMQQDPIHHVRLLIALAVSLSVTIMVIVLVCIFRYTTRPNGKVPKVLVFPKRSFPLVVLEMPQEHHYSLITTETEALSITLLPSNKVKDYPPNRCGYAARQPLQCERLESNNHAEDSTSDEYTASDSNKSSSVSSCAQTSGSSTENTLTLDKIQPNHQSKHIDTIILGNTETLVPNNINMGPLLDTLRLKNSNDLKNVPLNSLSIEAGADHLEYSDNDSYDSEDAQEMLSGHCTNCSTSDSCNGPKPIHPQRNFNSGYERRGYMS